MTNEQHAQEQCAKQITIGNASYLCILPIGHEGPCRRPALDDLTGRDVDAPDAPCLPSVELTRRAIIDALVKARVIGARQAVDRLIAAVEAKTPANLIQSAALRAPQGETCDWRDGDCWEASCGLKWGMDNDGTPAENQMAYCPKCGKRLNVLPPVSPATAQRSCRALNQQSSGRKGK